jgi:arsenate reductase
MDWKGFEVLKAYVEERIKEFNQIPESRKEELDRLAGEIRSGLAGEEAVPIIFICTHNSRRSHMSQLWALLAARNYGIEQIRCFSGGTEATAFSLLAVRAMKESGFRIITRIPGSNPVYEILFPGSAGEIRAFSKKYTEPPNPTRDFIAVMTCSDADEACPIVYGASSRHTIRYDDPKVFDGTPHEREGYAERCRQIAREMLFLFSGI